jgi:hypothetical protein
MSRTDKTIPFPSFFQIVNKMFLIYKKMFFKLFAIIFLPVIFCVFFISKISIFIAEYGGEGARELLLNIFLISGLVIFFLYAWSFVTFIAQISQVIERRHKSILQLYKESFIKTFFYISMNLLICVSLSLFYLIIEHITVLIIYPISIVLFSISSHILVLEEKGIIESLRQSILYVIDFFWHIAWKILLFFIIFNIITIIIFTPLYYYEIYVNENNIQSIMLMYYILIMYPTFLLYMLPIYNYFSLNKLYSYMYTVWVSDKNLSSNNEDENFPACFIFEEKTIESAYQLGDRLSKKYIEENSEYIFLESVLEPIENYENFNLKNIPRYKYNDDYSDFGW